MKLNAWRWWLAGVIVYLVFLLATFPAVYAVTWLQKRLPDVRLDQVSGSVWSGVAQDLILNGRSWGSLQWHFDWRAPFTGHLGYSLLLVGPDLRLQGRVMGRRADKLLFQDLQGQIPISRLESWLPLPSGSISGTLNLNLTRVVLVNRQPAEADGVINGDGIRLGWPQPVTLGNYQLKLQTQKPSGIRGNLLDTAGSLILQGKLSLTPNGRYQVSGTLASRDPADAGLNNLLHYLPTDASGKHPFQFTGQW
ncbi:MAG: type II secretion system protein N [Gammaproteobacteria bacterium]